jgi:hypothetical protein
MPLAGPVAAASGGPLTALADYIVYQELVSSILQLSEPALIAKTLAVCLTLALVNVLITALRPLAAACGAASSSGGVAGLCCWPLRVLEVPNSLGQVLGALLLVAVANKLLMLGVQAASAVMRWVHGAMLQQCLSERQHGLH